MRLRIAIAAASVGVVGVGLLSVPLLLSAPHSSSNADAATACATVNTVPQNLQIDGTAYARINADWSTYQAAATGVTVAGKSRPVPPELLAALHFREADNDPKRDMQTGDALGTGTTPSKDYTELGRPATLAQSALDAGILLQEDAQRYAHQWIDATAPSDAVIATALYAYDGHHAYYNRVAIQRGFTADSWRGSPFVVNLYDSKSRNMILLDPVTGQPGRVDTTPGVLTAYSELRRTPITGATTTSPTPTATTTTTAHVPPAYASVFTAAASAEHTNPADLAAIFVTEHGNAWPDPSKSWASSGTGAQGPFQFEPGTWPTYATDGNGDGKADVENLTDAAYSAAKMLRALGVTPTVPLGNIIHPWVRGTFMYAAGSYNAGGAALQNNTTPSSPLITAGLSGQVENYVANVYYLITTDFVHGNPGYGGPQGTVRNNSGKAASSVSWSSPFCAAPANVISTDTLTPTGTAAQLAAKLLADKNYQPLNSDVKSDLLATEKGQTINNSDTCHRTIDGVYAGLEQLLLNATTKYILRPINIISGHGCDPFLHPYGRASDIDSVTQLSTGLTTNFCGGPKWGCDPAGDNQTVDRQFAIYLWSLAPPHGIGLGQSECPGRVGAIPANPDFFPDKCNHQHVDMRRP